eukprot:TRINITY_DN76650_c0_g1_i1.p1 TRINITY_DN76650_c0_g1~~TRINITY_DN76650_c0_g1_i1.p1  ORF type:complete len:314 (+),score=67.72 TRINITY_DN76650_c0_g1_i1:126-1067(+)
MPAYFAAASATAGDLHRELHKDSDSAAEASSSSWEDTCLSTSDEPGAATVGKSGGNRQKVNMANSKADGHVKTSRRGTAQGTAQGAGGYQSASVGHIIWGQVEAPSVSTSDEPGAVTSGNIGANRHEENMANSKVDRHVTGILQGTPSSDGVNKHLQELKSEMKQLVGESIGRSKRLPQVAEQELLDVNQAEADAQRALQDAPSTATPEELEALRLAVPKDANGQPTSKGSIWHQEGNCRPCFFFKSPVGCSKGVECTFCHFHHRRRERTRPCKSKRDRFKKLVDRMTASECAEEADTSSKLEELRSKCLLSL